MNKEEYKKNVEKLNFWSRSYYTFDNPIVSDEIYDELYHNVLEFENKNPSEILSHSPTRRIGDVLLDGFNKANHSARMWSMEDIFNETELKTWLKRGNKENLSFVCEPKFDGASLNLVYDNGILIKAITRGDGQVGEDVLSNAKVIKSIPLNIDYKEYIEIRGEVVIKKDDFDILNNKRIKQGLPLLSNPRNAAAGSLRQLDPKITANRKLLFVPWGIGQNNLNFDLHSRAMEFIKSLGFYRDDFFEICNSCDINKIYKDLLSKRDEKNIMLDGMVIRIDDIKIANSFGYTVKFPKFMLAYKFPANEFISQLRAVKLQVGRSGVISPVANFDEVIIDGARVRSATLHNFDEIKRLDIKINDYISIIRSGDVIPKINRVLKDKRNGSEIDITIPNYCPSCNSELYDEEVLIKCLNLNCKDRLLGGIIYFASKKCLNIQGLGEAILKILFDKNIITSISDIYHLKQDDFLNLEGFKDKKINNILNAIKNSIGCELHKFITSLGCENIGEVAAKKISDKFKNNWINASKEELLEIPGFGDEMASSLLKFISINKEEILRLSEIVKPIYVEKINNNNIFSNKNIVITGTLSRSRDEIKAELESYGAKVTNSISTKTDFLLAGENAGSKLQKAQELGIKIIDEKSYQELL